MKVRKAIFKLTIVSIIAFVFFTAITSQLSVLYDLIEVENQLLRTMQREQEIYEQLTAEIESHNSDSFVERIARQQLGFVYPDEIVFIRE